MNTRKLPNLVAAHSMARFAVVKLPFSKPEWFDETHAVFLSLAQPFYDDITKVRHRFGINGMYRDVVRCWSTAAGPTELLRQLRMNLAAPEAHSEAILEVVSKYNLGERWAQSLEILSISDVLPLPFAGEIDVAIDGIDRVDVYEDSGGRLHEKYIRAENLPIRIMLTLSDRVSPTVLANFVSESSSIKLALAALPEKKKTRIKPDSKVIVWGYPVWVYKTYVNPNPDVSFAKVKLELEKALPEGENAPGSDELAGLYSAFLRNLSDFK